MFKTTIFIACTISLAAFAHAAITLPLLNVPIPIPGAAGGISASGARVNGLGGSTGKPAAARRQVDPAAFQGAPTDIDGQAQTIDAGSLIAELEAEGVPIHPRDVTGFPASAKSGGDVERRDSVGRRQGIDLSGGSTSSGGLAGIDATRMLESADVANTASGLLGSGSGGGAVAPPVSAGVGQGSANRRDGSEEGLMV